ncbi:MAG: hypothetical protein GY929_23670 [Actinomycetia bacterium]|nr:hypothetical protein [Actinomycetes bacterium]
MIPSPTAPPIEPSLLEEATEIATAASQLTLDWYGRSDLMVDRKTDGSPVTDADRAAEQFVRDELARRHPHDGVIGEEFPNTEGSSGRRWIVDPIDGTQSFIRKVPLFSTLLAVEDQHGSAVGVIVLPALDEVVAAGRGRGCTWNGSPCRVSTTPSLNGALITTSSFSNWPVANVAAFQGQDAKLRTWGDAYGYALVATGRADVMVDPEVELYDVAAMPVIIGEAGGRFTAIDGRPGANHGSGLATNGGLHDDAVTNLSSLGA